MALEDLISERLGIPVDVIRSAWCSQTTDVAVKSLKSLGTPGDTTKSAWCPQTAAANPLKRNEKVPWGHEGTPGTSEKNNTGCKRMTVDELLAQRLVHANPLKTQGTAGKRSRYGLPAQWERHLVTLGTQNVLARGGGRCIASALRFILAGWAEQALALGWTELELVGADPRAPWERIDWRGAAYSEMTVVAITADAMIYEGRARLRRGSQADGAKIPWELQKQPISDNAYG